MEKFDAIIVGAGLSGLSCACALADKGMEILLLERGDYPGSKNVSGGRFYVNPVRALFPDLWDKAPMERHIVNESLTLMAKERSLAVDYAGDELLQKPHQSYSVLRSKFDRWFATQVEAKGAMLLCKTNVDDLIKENNHIVGVIAGGDELRADVVIVADGVLSLVARKAGLQKPNLPQDYAVGIKEVIALDHALINDRFQLEENEGAARLYVGDITSGKFGGGFLYTNKDSISLGLVVGLSDIGPTHGGKSAPELYEAFKKRREIASLIKGGAALEYSAHLIPEGGLKTIGSLFGDGILIAGDAAGFALNIGFTVRGMEYAVASGFLAAQAVLQARELGDFSSKSLSVYKKLLEESFVLKDFISFEQSPEAVNNPRFFNYYPELIGNIMKDIYSVPAGAKDKLFTTVKRHIALRDILNFIKDAKRMTKI